MNETSTVLNLDSLLFLCSGGGAVSRVVNTYGPQTGGAGGGAGEAGEQPRGGTTRDCGNAAIEERLRNVETHLRLPAGERKAREDVCIDLRKCVVFL